MRIAALIIVASLLGSPTAATAATTPADPVFPRGLPHAYYEDACAGGKRCVWDGKHQGNGEGRSYILTRYDGDYLIKYISHRRAHRLQAAWCARKTVTCDGYTD